MKLQNKVALITGAALGFKDGGPSIGSAIGLKLASEGAKIVAVDILEEMGFERESFVPYKMASNLPTGYLKRLELARCLALSPEIIICDEVFSGLSMSEIASMVRNTPVVG